MFELATFKWSIDLKGGADCSSKKTHTFLKYDTSSELFMTKTSQQKQAMKVRF